MLISISGFKGGVAKTTTALHLAGYFATLGPTLLIDADSNRSALKFSQIGNRLPFAVLPEKQAMKHINAGAYQHFVFDTPANPEESDLLEIAQGVDLMILPTIPDRMSFDPLLALEPKLANLSYRVLITIAPPPPEKDGEQVRDALRQAGLPVFETMVRRRAAYKHANNEGRLVPISEYDSIGQEVVQLVKNK
jgi:chromosome partitioning protein